MTASTNPSGPDESPATEPAPTGSTPARRVDADPVDAERSHAGPAAAEPLSAAESLALIDAQDRRTRRALRPDPLGLYLPWGLAYLVGFGAVWLTIAADLLPWPVTTVLAILSFAGAVIASIVTLVRSHHGVDGPSRHVSTLYGWSWPLAFAALGVINSQLDGLGVPPPTISLIWSGTALLVVGLLMLAGGMLWPAGGQYVLGVWILVSAVASVVVGYPANFLVLALAGGGGFVVLAVVSRLRTGRGR